MHLISFDGTVAAVTARRGEQPMSEQEMEINDGNPRFWSAAHEAAFWGHTPV